MAKGKGRRIRGRQPGGRPDMRQQIMKLQPPIQKRIGYVMFSKAFYRDRRDLVECFWSTSAQLRESQWFTTMRAKYD